jgi:hypothetical protein
MSEKFQVVENTENGINHTASDLPFNRNERIDNLIHWIYKNVDLHSGESIEHDLLNQKIKIFKKLDDGTEQVILEGKFCSFEKCQTEKCCSDTGKCCGGNNV